MRKQFGIWKTKNIRNFVARIIKNKVEKEGEKKEHVKIDIERAGKEEKEVEMRILQEIKLKRNFFLNNKSSMS